MNQSPHLTTERIIRSFRSRFNPIRSLAPEALSRQLDRFDTGYLAEAAQTWQTIEERDDLIKAVTAKRKKAISRHGFEILPKPHLPPADEKEAQKHVEALRYFYTHLRCTHALDGNERGGFNLLVRQMMDAIGKRYAVHEIVWHPVPSVSGEEVGFLSAELRFVPLWFFENATGKLRFLAREGAVDGVPMEEGAWLVTAAEGLMQATSIAWMIKTMAMKDWLLYSERNGTPGLRGSTTAVRDSAEWEAMLTTLSDLLDGKAVLTTSAEDIKVVDLAAGSGVPFPALIERMDRMIAAMWRGADLSTISRDRGYGASLQEKEACLIEEDDAQLITDTLHLYLDRNIIRYLFGEGVEPLATVKVLVAARECTKHDLHVDEFLMRHGAPLSLRETLTRYGRPLPGPNEPLLPGLPGLSKPHAQLANEAASASDVAAGAGSALALAPGATGPFAVQLDDWFQLTPFGDFPHREGLQRMDAEAARQMKQRFDSFWSRLGRRFGGVPFYVGHPDAPGLGAQYPDKKAYGWVTALQVRADGLYARVKWSPAGRDLLQAGHYKFFSPFWDAVEIGQVAGRKLLRPVALFSVGLTNQPNLPVAPLANEETRTATAPASVSVAQPEAAPERMVALVNAAVRKGSILPYQRSYWLANLARDFGEVSARLARVAQPVLHVQSITTLLGDRKNRLAQLHQRQAQLQQRLREHLRAGQTYDEAWEVLKYEQAALFDAMQHP